jgi:predicted nucleic acid-binding protein
LTTSRRRGNGKPGDVWAGRLVPGQSGAPAGASCELATGEGAIVLCWPVLYAFMRLATSPRVFDRSALSVNHAWTTAAAYLTQPAVRIVVPGKGHASIAAELAGTPGLRSEDAPDIEIAALAVEHGLRKASHDHGFRRFARLRHFDPLADPRPGKKVRTRPN